MRVRTGLLAGEQAEDQQVGWLEGVNGNVVQVLILIHNVTANHGAKLQHRDSQLLGCLSFRVVSLAGFATDLHAHNCIVEGQGKGAQLAIVPI